MGWRSGRRRSSQSSEDDYSKLLGCDPTSDAWQELNQLSAAKASDYRLCDLGMRHLSQKDLAGVPECVWGRLESAATCTVQRLFASKLRQTKHTKFKNLKQQAQSDLLASATSAVSCCSYLSQWPSAEVKDLLRLGTYITLRPGEILFKQGERSFFAVLLSGSVSIEKGGKHGSDLCREGPAVVFPTRLTLQKKPCPHTVRCAARASLIEVEVRHVAAAMRNLPNHMQEGRDFFQDLAELSPQDRKIRSVTIFAEVHRDCLAKLSASLRERTYSHGERLCTAGEPVTELILLSSGKLKVSNVKTKCLNIGTEVHASTTHAIGEVEFFFKESHLYSLDVMGASCVVWTVSREDCMRCMDPTSLQELKSNCFRKRIESSLRERDKRGGVYEKNWLESFPLTPVVGSVCSVEIFRALKLWLAEPHETIVSSVSICDRVILITGGPGRAVYRTDGKRIPCPDFAIMGLSCLAQHRWLHPLVSVTYCNVWEIDRRTLAGILRSHKVLKAALHWVDDLLQTPFSPTHPDDIRMHPTSDMHDFKERLLSHRAPMFHKAWHEVDHRNTGHALRYQSPGEGAKRAPVAQVAEGSPVTSEGLRERLLLMGKPKQAPEQNDASFALVTAESEGHLTKKPAIRKQNPLRVKRPAAQGGGVGSGADIFAELAIANVADEGPTRESEITEVERRRRELMSFLEADLPFLPLPPGFMQGPDSPPPLSPRVRKARWLKAKAVFRTVAAPQLALPPPDAEAAAFEEIVKEKTLQQATGVVAKAGPGSTKPDLYGKYVNGVFRWHFSPAEKRLVGAAPGAVDLAGVSSGGVAQAAEAA